MSLTKSKLKKLFKDLDANADTIISNQLDLIDERLDHLEQTKQWRDVVALCQEYKEWVPNDNLEQDESVEITSLIRMKEFF